jgi:hypothetical protein
MTRVVIVIVIVNVMMIVIVVLLWEVLVRVCAIRFVMVLVRGFVSEPSEPVDLVAHRTSLNLQQRADGH